MPQELKLSELRYGLQASPGFQGNRLAPHEIVNIEINDEGRAELRPGYSPSDQAFTGSISNEQLVILHFVGDRFYDAVSRYQRIEREDRAEIFGRRLFIVGESAGANSWTDLESGDAYVWELSKPTVAPSLTLGKGNLTGLTGVEVIPNPFSDFVNVRVGVATDTTVKVVVFDQANEHIATLEPSPTATANAEQGFYNLDGDANNFYTFRWDGFRDDDADDQVARGVYYIRVITLSGGNETTHSTQAVGYAPGEDIDPDEAIISGDVETDLYELSDLGDLLPGTGMRRGNYLICYTYHSSIHGIETPPSPFEQIRVVTSTEAEEDKREIVSVAISNYLDELPRWADQVRFYVKRAGNQTNLTEPKDIPFELTYIGGPGREDLDDDIAETYQWANETIGDPPAFLETKEYETVPDQSGITSILSYAGRVWGYDKATHSIRFSVVDRPDVMPYDDARIVHAIRIDGSWQARVEALHVMPGNGGIYVFFQRAIRTIRGQEIVTGLHTISISPETDIDATGGINGKGTRSPETIVSHGSVVYYLDTDRKVYALGGGQVLETQEFSLSIQPFLDAATKTEIREARAVMYESRYHLMLGDRTYILDTQRNYWTIWDVEIDSIAHSVGGEYDEDVLYAIVDRTIVELYTGDAPDDTEWMWVTNYVDLPINSRISEVYLPHPEQMPPTVEMRIETERGISDWKEYEVHAGNFFRLGTFANADVRVRVYVRGEGEIPRFNELTIGVN